MTINFTIKRNTKTNENSSTNKCVRLKMKREYLLKCSYESYDHCIAATA